MICWRGVKLYSGNMNARPGVGASQCQGLPAPCHSNTAFPRIVIILSPLSSRASGRKTGSCVC